VFNGALSAIGNMTRGGAQVLPSGGATVQAPAPYSAFNAAT